MRRSSLTLAVLLLMGIFLANIAGAAENDLLLQITSPAFSATASETAQGCKADLFPLEKAMPATFEFCGPCSPSAICQGAQEYSYCGPGEIMGFPKRCKNLLGRYCPAQPETGKCTCTDQDKP